jgi:hypothetical protein
MRAVACAEPLAGGAKVGSYSLGPDPQIERDLVQLAALREECEDLALPAGQMDVADVPFTCTSILSRSAGALAAAAARAPPASREGAPGVVPMPPGPALP